jgi:hypothetical protein
VAVDDASDRDSEDENAETAADETWDVGGVEKFDILLDTVDITEGVTDNDLDGGNRSLNPVFCCCRIGLGLTM